MQYLPWALTNGNAVLTLSILIPIHHHWPNSILERLRNKRLDWHTETEKLTWLSKTFVRQGRIDFGL
jgi:hypothetical protein